MSTVTRSASLSATQLFGTIGTAANALTTTFNAIGAAADVLSTHANAWSARTREEVALASMNQSELARSNAALHLATRVRETDAILAKDPTLKTYYETALRKYAEKLDGEQQPTE